MYQLILQKRVILIDEFSTAFSLLQEFQNKRRQPMLPLHYITYNQLENPIAVEPSGKLTELIIEDLKDQEDIT